MCLPVVPFKIEKEWEHAGLKCAVVQAKKHGHRCGYVRVPPTHSLYDKDYNTPKVDVHGELTFAKMESCIEEDGVGYWYGFDCCHCDDAMQDPAIYPLSLELRDNHFWTHSEVATETERLAVQLAGMN